VTNVYKSKTYIKYLITIIVGIFLLFRPPADPDFGWHYKYGEYITTHKRILKENIFSYTMADYEWANSYWISQVIFYILYTNFGAIGMGIILSTIFAVISYELLKKRQAAWFLLLLFLGTSLITVRPMYFSTIFLLILIKQLIYKKELLWWFPIMFLFWANMHADFVLGLGILGLFVITKLNIKNIIVGISCVLVTFINPYGVGLWTTLIKELQPLQFSHIGEWTPQRFQNDIQGIINQNVFYVLGGLLISAAIIQKKKCGLWYVLLSILFFLASLRSRYFFRILLILNIFVFDDFWIQNLKKLPLPYEIINKLKPVFLSFLGLVIGLFFVNNVWLASDIKKWSQKYGYPYERIQKLKQNPISGNIFNDYNWGGYIIWQLPEYKTFVDGRMPSWRDDSGYSIFENYVNITGKENETLLKKYKEKYNINLTLSKNTIP